MLHISVYEEELGDFPEFIQKSCLISDQMSFIKAVTRATCNICVISIQRFVLYLKNKLLGCSRPHLLNSCYVSIIILIRCFSNVPNIEAVDHNHDAAPFPWFPPVILLSPLIFAHSLPSFTNCSRPLLCVAVRWSQAADDAWSSDSTSPAPASSPSPHDAPSFLAGPDPSGCSSAHAPRGCCASGQSSEKQNSVCINRLVGCPVTHLWTCVSVSDAVSPSGR